VRAFALLAIIFAASAVAAFVLFRTHNEHRLQLSVSILGVIAGADVSFAHQQKGPSLTPASRYYSSVWYHRHDALHRIGVDFARSPVLIRHLRARLGARSVGVPVVLLSSA